MIPIITMATRSSMSVNPLTFGPLELSFQIGGWQSDLIFNILIFTPVSKRLWRGNAFIAPVKLPLYGTL